MSNAGTDAAFWRALDALVASSMITIDRPRGSVHPRNPAFFYPVDYGYLSDTASMDGEGIDVWLGKSREKAVRAIICTVDLFKRDSEIKVLCGCTEEETALILAAHNSGADMKGILIQRPDA